MTQSGKENAKKLVFFSTFLHLIKIPWISPINTGEKRKIFQKKGLQ
jgi:hypothetical protein